MSKKVNLCDLEDYEEQETFEKISRKKPKAEVSKKHIKTKKQKEIH